MLQPFWGTATVWHIGYTCEHEALGFHRAVAETLPEGRRHEQGHTPRRPRTRASQNLMPQASIGAHQRLSQSSDGTRVRTACHKKACQKRRSHTLETTETAATAPSHRATETASRKTLFTAPLHGATETASRKFVIAASLHGATETAARKFVRTVPLHRATETTARNL